MFFSFIIKNLKVKISIDGIDLKVLSFWYSASVEDMERPCNPMVDLSIYFVLKVTK